MGAKENSNDVDKDVKQERRESDYEPVRDSLYSPSNENKNKRNTRVSEKITRKESMENFIRGTKNSNNRQDSSKLQFKTPNNSQKKLQKPNRASLAPKTVNNKKAENVKTPSNPPSEISEESDDKISEEVKEIDTLDDAGTDVETVDIDTEENSVDDDIANQSANQKIVDMEHRIEQLEEELREVAALEISLYSMVPEHGSSAHKVHTPARRLSRLYIHACKHWSHCKRATVAKNIVSGIVLIAKSCGNDVSRLTFWLSNTVVLREVISQTFGNLFHHDSVDRSDKLNGSANKSESRYPSAKLKNISDGKRPNVIPQMDDWQETSTFAAALENIESWIFSRAVESVWWQTLTPHMQSPKKNLHTEKGMGKTLGPALGDIHQCNLSINLWNTAFHDAFTRLCPVRSSGHECGCLPVLARMVMEECVSRLDVAMFNAILRESATEMPTDPISDPIVDSKVLPIPAGDLSFGSGAQLKNSIGNWSRCLSDFFGLDSEDCTKDVEETNEHYDTKRANTGSKSFALLNELSDLLMLPKDMLIDKDIRKEICPSINLSLITRILCNFTPDEFCPDHVPGIVLEDLNAESLLELSQSEKDRNNIFPYLATPVLYKPPSPSDVANKVADVNGKIVLGRNASILRRKGYTSDDDLDDLDSPLKSIVNKTINRENSSKENDIFKEKVHTNARFKLLREVWTE